MAIVDSLRRLAASMIGILHNRLELLSIEVEEELLRLVTFLIGAFFVSIGFGITLILINLLLLLLFWDTHRIAAIVGLIVLYGGVSTYFAFRVWRNYREKPRLLAASLNELKKDMQQLGPQP